MGDLLFVFNPQAVRSTLAGRQRDREGRPLAGGALDGEGSPVRFHDALADRKAQAAPAVGAVTRRSVEGGSSPRASPPGVATVSVVVMAAGMGAVMGDDPRRGNGKSGRAFGSLNEPETGARATGFLAFSRTARKVNRTTICPRLYHARQRASTIPFPFRLGRCRESSGREAAASRRNGSANGET